MVGNFKIHWCGLAMPIHVDAVAQVVNAEFRDERRFSGDHDFVWHGKIGDGRHHGAETEAGAVHQIRRLRFVRACVTCEIVE